MDIYIYVHHFFFLLNTFKLKLPFYQRKNKIKYFFFNQENTKRILKLKLHQNFSI